MSSFVKFLKNILMKKRNPREFKMVALITKECSTILTSKIPRKMKDSGSFTIIVSIGG